MKRFFNNISIYYSQYVFPQYYRDEIEGVDVIRGMIGQEKTFNPLEMTDEEIKHLHKSIINLEIYDKSIPYNRHWRTIEEIKEGSFKISEKQWGGIIRLCNKYGLPGGIQLQNIVLDKDNQVQNTVLGKTDSKLIKKRNEIMVNISTPPIRKGIGNKPFGLNGLYFYQPVNELLLDLFELHRLIYVYTEEVFKERNDIHCYYINRFLEDVSLGIFPDTSHNKSKKSHLQERLYFIPTLTMKNLKQAIAFKIYIDALNPSVGVCSKCGKYFKIGSRGTKIYCNDNCAALKRNNDYYKNHKDEIAKRRRAKRDAKKYLLRWSDEVNNIPELRKIWKKFSSNINPFTYTVLPPLMIGGLSLFKKNKREG